MPLHPLSKGVATVDWEVLRQTGLSFHQSSPMPEFIIPASFSCGSKAYQFGECFHDLLSHEVIANDIVNQADWVRTVIVLRWTLMKAGSTNIVGVVAPVAIPVELVGTAAVVDIAGVTIPVALGRLAPTPHTTVGATTTGTGAAAAAIPATDAATINVVPATTPTPIPAFWPGVSPVLL